jgi:hypothetical protein
MENKSGNKSWFEIIAWLIGTYFVWKLIAGFIANAEYTPGDNGLYSPAFAAPIAYPGPVTGQYYQWQRPWRPSRRRSH